MRRFKNTLPFFLSERTFSPLAASTVFQYGESLGTIANSSTSNTELEDVLGIYMVDQHGCFARLTFESNEDLEVLRDTAMRGAKHLGLDPYSLIRGSLQPRAGTPQRNWSPCKTEDLRRVHLEPRKFHKAKTSLVEKVKSYALDPAYWDIAKAPSIVLGAIPDDVWNPATVGEMLQTVVCVFLFVSLYN